MHRLKMIVSVAVLIVASVFASTTISCGGSNGGGRDLGKLLDFALGGGDLAKSNVDAKIPAACKHYCACQGSSTSSGCVTDCTADLSSSVNSSSSSSSTSTTPAQLIECLAGATNCTQVNTCLGASSSS